MTPMQLFPRCHQRQIRRYAPTITLKNTVIKEKTFTNESTWSSLLSDKWDRYHQFGTSSGGGGQSITHYCSPSAGDVDVYLNNMYNYTASWNESFDRISGKYHLDGHIQNDLTHYSNCSGNSYTQYATANEVGFWDWNYPGNGVTPVNSTVNANYKTPSQIHNTLFADYGRWRKHDTLNEDLEEVIDLLALMQQPGPGNSQPSHYFVPKDRAVHYLQFLRFTGGCESHALAKQNNSQSSSKLTHTLIDDSPLTTVTNTSTCSDCDNKKEHLHIKDGNEVFHFYNTRDWSCPILSRGWSPIYYQNVRREIYLGTLDENTQLVWKNKGTPNATAVPLVDLEEAVSWWINTPDTVKEWDAFLKTQSVAGLITPENAKEGLRKPYVRPSFVGQNINLAVDPRCELDAITLQIIINTDYQTNSALAYDTARKKGLNKTVARTMLRVCA